MRRIASAVIVLSVALVPMASHAAVAEYKGTVMIGNPASVVDSSLPHSGGITENGNPCAPGGNLDGLDGKWFKLADGSGGLAASLTYQGTPTQADDIDVYFYEAPCKFINSYAMATGKNPEVGIVPSAATYVIVDGWSGVNLGFTLTVGTPE